MSPRSFQRLEAAGVLAPSVPGTGPNPGLYDLAVVVPAYLRHLARERPEPAKDRRDRSQAELNELKLKERRGEVVEAADVERSWARQIVEARTQILAVPSRLQGRRPDIAREDLVVLTELLRESLTALADGGREAEPDKPDGAPS